MANTYTSLHYHVIFSTKNREPWIAPDIEERVWRFIGGIARKHDMSALQIGGVEDHLHALVTAPPILAPSQIRRSSKVNHPNGSTANFIGSGGSPGRTDIVLLALASRIFLPLSLTSKINGNIIVERRSRKNIWNF